jgi:hypothetical protein
MKFYFNLGSERKLKTKSSRPRQDFEIKVTLDAALVRVG